MYGACSSNELEPTNSLIQTNLVLTVVRLDQLSSRKTEIVTKFESRRLISGANAI